MESKDKKEEPNPKDKNEAWLQYIYDTTFKEEDREFWKKMLSKKKIIETGKDRSD